LQRSLLICEANQSDQNAWVALHLLETERP